MTRQPVRGQAAKWCVCGDWFASERDERDHVGRCPGPVSVTRGWMIERVYEALNIARAAAPETPRDG